MIWWTDDFLGIVYEIFFWGDNSFGTSVESLDDSLKIQPNEIHEKCVSRSTQSIGFINKPIKVFSPRLNVTN